MHKDFKLQGQVFENESELIDFSETISDALASFLTLWFDDSDTLSIQTSGSTGKPKLIAIKKEFMKNSAKATGSFFGLEAGIKALCCLSVDFIAGKMMVVRALELGWDLDFMEPVSNPLENAYEPYDFAAMVPMQVQASLWDLHLVKKLIIGGGVVSNVLEEQLQHVNTECYATYGMTESVTHIAVKKLNVVTSSDVEETKHSIEKLGKMVFEPSREATSKSYYKILTNISISQDSRGCLVIDAPLLSEEKIITNDIVKQHSATEFEWLGRYDNVINSGGVKLHPEQIEKKLSRIINERFFVAGISDEVLGEKLVLVIEGGTKDYDFSTISLSKYQTPKQIVFIDAFVETQTKKIQRSKTLDLLKF